MKPNIDLHIDRLVLEGLGALNRAAVSAAVQAELARLFAEEGAGAGLHRSGRTPRLDGGSFQVASGAGAEAVGRQVANAIYGGMNR